MWRFFHLSKDMKELIKLNKIKINGKLVQTVNAWELHVFMKVCEDFKSWIKDRLDTLGSQRDQDYVISVENERNRLEYFVTLETAKYLAMMEKTDRGNEARDYLIQCQKDIKQVGAAGLSEQLLIEQINKEKEARRAAQIELERLKEWRNKVAIKLRREGVEEDVINNLLKN